MDKIFINHQLVDLKDAKVSILDRGYSFGDGVYEVIRFYNGVLFRLEDHLERFKRSVQELDIHFEFDMELLKSEIDFLIKKSGYNSGYIYAQISRGIGKRDHVYVDKELSGPQYIMYVVQEEERPLKVMENGIKVLLTEEVRWSRCDIKSLNLLGSVMAKNEAYRRGAKEAVFHRNGYITEGSATNVFAVKDGVLYTHPANNFILNGITRLAIIEIAKELNIPVVETPFIVEFFKQADEAFTSASVSEISPIIEFEEDVEGSSIVRKLGKGARGNITKAIQDKYGEYIAK
ncbi:D-amino-acid transaminase [Bacillus thuringiensis]|uniref:D-amino-acid transaminase n=1 Tax=Bacillus thuringiensis TaxID=1428 RepID=UPI0021D69920|nr:D-amino-acid transaminase [Bacillus thuringiensis]MCU7667074.1 D-amino-acid transaminase [Bacillus thuringiensis]